LVIKIEFDNGLTAEQQAEADAKYEELMEIVKEKDSKLYQKMMSEVITYEKFMRLTSNENKQKETNNQIEMLF